MSLNERQKAEIKRLLDQQLVELESDRAVTERLRRARANALSTNRSWIGRYAPALGLTAVAALLLAVTLPLLLPQPVEAPDGIDLVGLQDLELVSQLEDFEEDMAFYYWLEEHDATSG